jgi:hypothetical protein
LNAAVVGARRGYLDTDEVDEIGFETDLTGFVDLGLVWLIDPRDGSRAAGSAVSYAGW